MVKKQETQKSKVMNDHVYILDEIPKLKLDKKRLRVKHCPCNKSNKDGKFVPFVGFDDKGYCHSCGKTYLPELSNNRHRSENWKRPAPIEKINRSIDYLPFEVFEKSVVRHEQSNLFPFLVKLFREDVAKRLCEDYFIGTNNVGNTVFWQVDVAGKIRQAKVMQYNPSTGKRNKETGAYFVGKKILQNSSANLQQCFFGEYLLSFPENYSKPVCLVESEKTAVIASIYFPQFVWLATGGKIGCKWTEKEVCKVLAGKKVILFPDLGAYSSWEDKGKLLAIVSGSNVDVSNILEKYADQTDRDNGLDIADYILRVRDTSGLALTDKIYPVIWDL